MKVIFKAVTLIFWISSAFSLMAAEYYVSPRGHDDQSGSKAKPFATIAQAKKAVSKINTQVKEDITVYLREGKYVLDSSIVFGPKDSGKNGYKVIYRAFPGETPVVSGGQVIQGWTLHDKDRNIYKVSVGDLEFRQIYINGVRGVRARTPNRNSEIHLGGYFRGASVTGKKPHQLKVNPKELSQWKNLNQVEVVMVTHWKQKRARISSFEGGLVSFQSPENMARPMHHLEQGGTPHFYENAYEFLDAEGEFYLNTLEKILYYKPRHGEDLSSAEVIAPKVESLFEIMGSSKEERVTNLTFEGITFEYTNWIRPSKKGYQVMQSSTWNDGVVWNITDKAEPVPGAIQMSNAEGIVIHACTIMRTGAHGIAAIRDVVKDCSILGNLVHDTSAGGIYLLLNHKDSTDNRIHDNTVEKIGMEYTDGCGILVARTPDVSILHNEIRDVRYTGISTGWAWNDKDTAAKNHDVGYNLIHRTMGLHDDGGGIYTLGKIEGMKIHHNYIHNITRSKFSGSYGICGIYLDNGSCFKQVHDNVIENVEAAFFSGNPPNYQNVFERNYHNVRLAKKIEKANVVKNNIKVTGSNWPNAARSIMDKAGPRGDYRKPKYIWTQGRVGGGKVLSGEGEFVTQAHSSELEPEQMTLQTWIRLSEYPKGPDNRRWIVNKNSNEVTDGHYAIFISGDKAGAYLNIGGGPKAIFGVNSRSGSLGLNQWHHLAMTYDGKDMCLYLDGQEVGKKTVNLKRKAGNSSLVIGRRQDGYKSTCFKGHIDEVRVYNRALKAEKLKAHFAKPREIEDVSNEKGLVAYWPF